MDHISKQNFGYINYTLLYIQHLTHLYNKCNVATRTRIQNIANRNEIEACGLCTH